MKDVQILRVFFLGVMAIIGILSLQTYWVVNNWNTNEEEFNERVHSALYRVAQSIAKMNDISLPARNLIKQRSANYYIVNTETEIDPSALEFYLQTELERQQLRIDFEYAVFDCSNRQMVYGNYCTYGNQDNAPSVQDRSNLPSDQDFTYYFGVRFPNRSNFLFGKMQIALILTGILFVTVLFFAYSLWIIFRQKRFSEMQKDFINNMTHEFKTPLSTIQIAADVFLKHTEVQKDQRLLQYAGIIKEQNTRLNHQVERVLDIARFEKDNFDLHLEWIDMSDLILTVTSSARLRVQERGGKLELELDQTIEPVWGDRFHLTNLLHSLLDNAIKYSLEAPKIMVSLEALSPLSLQLKIQDSGIGIPKEYQAKIFEKFYRIPTGNVHNVKGFGLGLYYVQRICLAHGWKIRLQSDAGQGTCMAIVIPRTHPKNTPAHESTPVVR
ncbi:HAMP domain-containing sensor histidine kinase [Haliscomenobacter sp.]|uniref:sensor histidine kinase n=1 Tax=Haliscomenobacter sp. TaxID=2717303 RepID=UPI003364EA02